MELADAALRADIEGDQPTSRERRIQLIDELQIASDEYVEKISRIRAWYLENGRKGRKADTGEGKVNSKNAYIALAVVFAASLAVVVFFHFFPVGAISNLAALPAIGSLCYALFQLGRDTIAHERSIHLEETKNRFTVGATSHMANVAFDKHVEFCEAYSSEMFSALTTLFSRGPHADALKHAPNLIDIRKKWAVWLTSELETELERFESAIHSIGANAWLLREAPEMDGRGDVISEMYAEFAKVVGLQRWKGEPVTRELALVTAVEKLREVLGTKQLTELRSELMTRAHDNIASGDWRKK
jgi:hypothetical protein